MAIDQPLGPTDKVFLGLAVVLSVAGFALRDQFLPLSDDVAWLAYIAVRMLAGDTVYLDLFEENLPLIVHLSLPVIWLGGLAGLSVATSILASVHLLIIASYALSARYLEPVGVSVAGHRVLKGLFLYLALVQPAIDFAQREHLMVLAVTPFLLLSGWKLDGGRAGRVKSLSCAVLAGFGFALKPHFAVAFCMLVVVVWIIHRRRIRIILAELLAIALVGAVSGLSMIHFHPEYLQIVLPVVVKYYALTADAERTLRVLALAPALLVLLAGFCTWAVLARASFARRFAGREKLLLAASLIFALVFLLQGKGLPFQFLPATLWGYLLGGMIFVHFRLGDGARGFGARGIGGWLAAAVVLPFMLMWPVGFHSVWPGLAEYRARPLSTLAADNFKGQPFLILTPHLSTGFPLVVYTDVIWASRYSSLWMLSSLIDGGPAARPALSRVLGNVAADLRRYRPAAVLVDLGGIEIPSGGRRAVLDLLGQGRDFARIWRGYGKICHGSRFALYGLGREARGLSCAGL